MEILRYHNTFIELDFRSNPILVQSNKRSQSLPPTRSQKMLTTVELERHTYVSQLKDRVTKTFSWPTCRLSGGTIGSYGHPELCGKPCIRFYFGSCTKGVNCEFCHLVHDQPKKKLDKEQRQRLQRLSEAQVLSLLLYQMETRCREKQMTDRLIFVLVSLRRRLRQHRESDPNFAANAQVQELHGFFANIFKKLSIARLIDLMKNHPAVSQELKDEVTELLNHETLQSSPKGDSS
mmetsp:Transcript_93981/g.130476  ORF Transcript_93981/g.130476 Transcript_93981/m.130476 type:complete len:235 (+) Transcript_93981:125-829(+)|eukprot:symbB.v1.2.009284.t1/scaffold571.1/size186967/2